VRLSIVIGTRNRAESLWRCLQSVAAQTRRPDEVWIIDDGRLEPERFVTLLQAAGITTHYCNKSHDPGLTKSRNLGIRRSTGDVVMFLDDDVVLDPGYVAAIMDTYAAHPEAGGVGGRLRPMTGSPLKRWFLRAFLLDSSREGRVLPNGIGVLVREIHEVTPVEWFSGCNMSYRRQVFDRFMFDEEFAGNGWGDDRDFSYSVSRAYPLLASPAATLEHVEDPRSRAVPRQFGRVEILYVHRFFVKHMPRRARNIAALWWGFLGITLKNVLTARPAQVRGNLEGMWLVARGRGGVAA
jgi:glycosyltransferase involved in cell wall biosynthesis